jgi:hypothetical protein
MAWVEGPGNFDPNKVEYLIDFISVGFNKKLILG